MSGIPSIFVLSIGSAALAVSGFVLTRKLVKRIDVDEHQKFLDAMLSIVGTLVSILLGLLVAAAMDRYDNLERAVDAEATGVATVFRLSRGLPADRQKKIQQLCCQYCQQVIADEWPAMAQGHMSHNVFLTYGQLLDQVVTLIPANNGESNLQSATIEALNNISEGRRERALAIHYSWGGRLIPVLLICALIVIAFTYLYVKRGAFVHAIVIGFVAITLGGNIGVVYLFSKPFDGDWKIQPRGFELNGRILQECLSSPEINKTLPATQK